jgi:hypothetical protein
MACQRLNLTNEARQLLASALEAAKTGPPPKPEDSDPSDDWIECIIAQALLRGAVKLIGDARGQ